MTREEIVETIKNELATILNIEIDQVDEETNFLKIGLSSVQALKVINRLRKQFSVEINPAVIFEFKRVGDIADYFKNELG